MKRILSVALVFIVLTALVFWLFLSPPGVELTLVAQGRTEVWSDVGGHGALLKTLAPGTRLRILRCVDSKSFMDYQVQLPNGRFGYVGAGALVDMKKPDYAVWISNPLDLCR